MGRRGRCRNSHCDTGRFAMNIRAVREAGGIGDIVRIIPALRGLREKYPMARLWVFAPATYRPLLHGWYDEFRATPHHGRRTRDAALDERNWPYLRAGITFDLSVSLYCPSFRHEQRQRGNVWLDRIDLFCKAADVAPVSRTPRVNLAPAHVAAVAEYIRTHNLRNGGRLVAIQPFSTDPARNWPAQNFVALTDALERTGHCVVILDGCKGRTAAFRQHRALEKPLGFVAAFIAQCDLLVGPDSGLGHLAAAVGTPAVGIFASQSPGVMYRHYSLHTYVYPSWDDREYCNWPCFWNRRRDCTRSALLSAGRTCPMLARIPVEDVLDAVITRLDSDEQEELQQISLDAMDPEDRATLGDIEKIGDLPIPHPDFALDRIALTRATDNLGPILKEAFRVLRPGGTLHVAFAESQDLEELLIKCGFGPIAKHEVGHPFACRKHGTWPRPHIATPPNLTHAAARR